jgi:hypothetical protein
MSVAFSTRRRFSASAKTNVERILDAQFTTLVENFIDATANGVIIYQT